MNGVRKCNSIKYFAVLLYVLVVTMLATGIKVHGFKPGQGTWIFKGNQNLQHDFPHRGVKGICPCIRFCSMLKIPAKFDRDTCQQNH
jgi:hypothetical protein